MGASVTAKDDARPQALGERITITLIQKAEGELRRLQGRTGLSKTDLVNRAITLYEFIDAQQRAGHDLIDRVNEQGKTKLVRLVDARPGQALPAGPALRGRGPAGRRRRPGRHRRLLSSPRQGIRLLPLTGLAGQEVRTR
jgi:hypothetical protein